jgi:multidrug transporter EmrE-like cation transporter
LSADTDTVPIPTTKRNQAKANVMVGGCTVLGAAAQMLIKRGLLTLPPSPGGAGAGLEPWINFVLGLATNLPLMAGLSCYGLSTGLLVLALRYGELSVLYPIIALTYVWVSILSVALLGETMNGFKLVGLCVIVLGVTVLGRTGPKAQG